jgi:hypothetical protein
MRWWPVLVLVLSVACKKKEQEPEPDPAPAKPSVGHSSTKVNGEQGGEGAQAADTHEAAKTAEEPEGKLYGGNGSPASRDDKGHVHGPGGPIYMGKGPECTDKINHCLRDGVWFSVGNVQRGRLYRATPAFKFEDAWWSFREDKITDAYAFYATKVVEQASELKVGSPVIWLAEENSSEKWLNSEHDALTSSRWEAGIIEAVNGDTFRVAGWAGSIPTDTARVITQESK